ncbi:AraC family transcriptional regulator [Rubrivivax sp. A210]|uniref:helix-turn-helix domain-containing protein n=1 Tax=Rubrivivax sp. A210 TaxID=2772301 RepID=UPI0019C14656|nr:helix-turn-helix domain-containing protein [Rubrivivax sp. A210]CAD5372708.1 AraC family transcriptional regulator [Rubrivivax sp. A210]
MPDTPIPDPQARAPRVATPPSAWLHPAPPALQGAVVAVVCRDTRGLALSAAQRITHFPASPLLGLSWFQSTTSGLLARDAGTPRWQPFGAELVVSGSQSEPTTCWSPNEGRGGIVCFSADTARRLFGLDPAAVHDRFVDARTTLDASWTPLLEALLAAPDDAATLAALQQHIAPRWQALQGRPGVTPSLRQFGRHWVERLALQAHDWRRTLSPRQVERRVKAYSGRSLRDWNGLVRTEGVFFAARERHEAGLPYDWAALAAEEGFADQSHLVRATRRVSGFAPGEFAERFVHDESFWLYRLWI